MLQTFNYSIIQTFNKRYVNIHKKLPNRTGLTHISTTSITILHPHTRNIHLPSTFLRLTAGSVLYLFLKRMSCSSMRTMISGTACFSRLPLFSNYVIAGTLHIVRAAVVVVVLVITLLVVEVLIIREYY